MPLVTRKDFARLLYRRRTAYRATFMDEHGQLTLYGAQVLNDLMKFCRFNTSTARASATSAKLDPIAIAIAEGRREVFLRIIGAMHLDQRKLIAMATETETNEE